ncbi:hypothetical protein WS69_02275 [Burkholderia sp. BDU5]|nr:hypothetical protein WS69_02275 [Burkholderia sp. BDU5]
MNSSAPTSATPPNVATTTNVVRQPKCWPMNVPSGMPAPNATVIPLNIVTIALAVLSFGTNVVAITEPIGKNTPCASPVSTRATISGS